MVMTEIRYKILNVRDPYTEVERQLHLLLLFLKWFYSEKKWYIETQ